MGFLDLLFPKQCVACGKLGSYLCSDCLLKIEYLDTQICSYCYRPAIFGYTHPKCKRRFGLDGVISLTNYQTPIKEVIKKLKYRLITDILVEVEEKLNFSNDVPLAKDSTLLPLPLFRTKENYRGFNQTELLGKVIAKKLQMNYQDDLLVRTLSTKSQVGLTQKQRSANVKNAFAVQKFPDQQKYFIFDDVWTSGATLKEACFVLKKSGVKMVFGLTLAHPR